MPTPSALRPTVRNKLRPDTRKLLAIGTSILLTGIIAVVITDTVFGGIGPQGPHNNPGWLLVMLAMGCLPTGFLTLLLALFKVKADRSRQPG